MVDSVGLRARFRQVRPIPLDAEIDCGRGELLTLVGPSGSGKSTILRAIAGIHRPSQGRVACDGDVWFDTQAGIDLPVHRRAVGFVFQSYALFPHKTALDNVGMALGRLSAGERARQARDLLARVHLEGLEDRRPAELSGGQQQRVAVARALARDPKVLLLDEPFSAVDRSTRHRLYRELAELRRGLRVPIVLVTHDLDEALRLSDRLTILKAGRTLQSGAPYEVMSRPASVEAARLLDIKNIFAGCIERQDRDGGRTWLRWGPHLLEIDAGSDLAVDTPVAWAIPTARVVLHRRDRPSRGEAENPILGTVVEYIPLGDTVSLALALAWEPQFRLFVSVPLHVAQRNGIGAGIEVTVSLLRDAIHLMPAPADPGQES